MSRLVSTSVLSRPVRRNFPPKPHNSPNNSCKQAKKIALFAPPPPHPFPPRPRNLDKTLVSTLPDRGSGAYMRRFTSLYVACPYSFNNAELSVTESALANRWIRDNLVASSGILSLSLCKKSKPCCVVRVYSICCVIEIRSPEVCSSHPFGVRLCTRSGSPFIV
jgi:hypothetical protein